MRKRNHKPKLNLARDRFDFEVQFSYRTPNSKSKPRHKVKSFCPLAPLIDDRDLQFKSYLICPDSAAQTRRSQPPCVYHLDRALLRVIFRCPPHVRVSASGISCSYIRTRTPASTPPLILVRTRWSSDRPVDVRILGMGTVARPRCRRRQGRSNQTEVQEKVRRRGPR